MDCMACYHSNTVLISVTNSYSIYVFFKHACHTPLVAEGEWEGSRWYISIHVLQKVLNTSASNNVWRWTHKSW